MVVVGLFATPLILHWLHDERFGAFQVTTDWMGYLGLLEFGLGGALMPLIAISEARRDEKSVHDLMVTGVRAYTKVAMVERRRGCYPRALRDAADSGAAALCVGPAILVSDRRVRRSDDSAAAVPRADRRPSAGLLAERVSERAIDDDHRGLAHPGVGGLGNHRAIRRRRRRRRGIQRRAAMAMPQRSPFNFPRRHQRSGAGSSAQRRAQAQPSDVRAEPVRTSLSADRQHRGFRTASPALVTPFVLTQRLTSLAQRELQTIGNASWAALAELSAQGRKEVFSRRLLELTRVVAVLGLAALVPIVAFNRQFVSLWVGGGRYAGDLITALAAVNGLLQAIFSLWGWCATGTGQIRRIIPMTIVQTALNLVLSITFTFAFGLAGPLLGTTAAFMAVSVWYMPMLMSEMFEVPASSLIYCVAAPIALALPYAAVIDWLVRSYGATGWIGIAYQMSVGRGGLSPARVAGGISS